MNRFKVKRKQEVGKVGEKRYIAQGCFKLGFVMVMADRQILTDILSMVDVAQASKLSEQEKKRHSLRDPSHVRSLRLAQKTQRSPRDRILPLIKARLKLHAGHYAIQANISRPPLTLVSTTRLLTLLIKLYTYVPFSRLMIPNDPEIRCVY
ncbi:hypothetical protein NEOLEDRAFT_718294 [Neolentinus lepideus HHB14362 ss-1]|uniref:Uncharacterized protein n=1 Tax=Neolentinus lepideus HHB14362 ss-1 TaxID=1314782 RepID=A0A165Q5G3_9AGAM|nr:hypothetical protein NEOLEDRAFT_718294 [Neolentinus lepideus HHB14362 ss-1]